MNTRIFHLSYSECAVFLLVAWACRPSVGCPSGFYRVDSCAATCPWNCAEPDCSLYNGTCTRCSENWDGAWCNVKQDADQSSTQGYHNETSVFSDSYKEAGSYPNIFIDLTFNQTGLVTSVTSYSVRAGPMFIAAWRNISGGWTLVAKSRISVIEGRQTIQLNDPFFYVNASDAVAYHFDDKTKRGALRLKKKEGHLRFINLDNDVLDPDVPLGITTRELQDNFSPDVVLHKNYKRSVGLKVTVKELPLGICPPGLTQASQCTQICPGGLFGMNCSAECVRCSGRRCSELNGRCLDGCVDGYQGQFCLEGCPQGKYGPSCTHDCSTNCDDVCDHVTGNCTQCKAGWTSVKCDEACPDGTYGANCSSACGHCREGALCHHVTGQCPDDQCAKGWQSPLCRQECDLGWYGHNCQFKCGHCDCDDVTGLCDSCDVGWQGKRCTDPCPAHLYGPACNSSCGQCRGGASCDHVTGYCPESTPRCQDGYQTLKCDTDCPAGSYGTSCANTCQCSNITLCNPRTGVCKHCDGDGCFQECPSGRFGPDCQSVCGLCFEGALCDQESGFCPENTPRCAAGKHGEHCNISCPRGYHGADCLFPCPQECPTLCDSVSGVCASALCLDGACAVNTSSPWTGAGFRYWWVLLVVSLAVLLLSISLVIILLKRKQRRRRPPSLHEETKSVTTLTLDHVTQPLMSEAELKESPAAAAVEEQIYENYTVPTQPLLISEISDHVQAAHAYDEPFQYEYTRLPSGQTAKWECGLRAEVSGKNRFRNILPYDFNRVILKEVNGPGSDYINASFVSGFDGRMYIASHGPMKKTIDDFWRMIWEYEVKTIVMLTGLVEDMKPKCDKYWPSDGISVYGGLTVMPETEEVWPDATMRSFSITCGLERRPLRHYQYTTWPDHGVPDHAGPLLRLRNRVKRENGGGLFVIHCSAGVGRTGTFIALDCLLDEAEVTGRVDTLGIAARLRNARINMIQTLDQYCFLYDALNEALGYGPTTIPCHCFQQRLNHIQQPNSKGESVLSRQYQFLETVKPEFSPEEFDEALQHMESNRDLTVLPAEKHRVFLVTPGVNSYINAVPVKGYRKTRGYYLTQFPLDSTVAEFWSLVEMLQINSIVCLGTCAGCPQWLPAQGAPVCLGPTTVRLVHPSVLEGSKVILNEVVVETRPLTSTLSVCVLQLQSLDPDSVIDLHQAVNRWQQRRGDTPTLVICPNGAELSGVYVCTSILIDMANTEQEADVFQVVKQARSSRPQIITSQAQYKFLFDVVAQYIEDFSNYSNFK